jgi:hypothetical protein
MGLEDLKRTVWRGQRTVWITSTKDSVWRNSKEEREKAREMETQMIARWAPARSGARAPAVSAVAPGLTLWPPQDVPDTAKCDFKDLMAALNAANSFDDIGALVWACAPQQNVHRPALYLSATAVNRLCAPHLQHVCMRRQRRHHMRPHRPAAHASLSHRGM